MATSFNVIISCYAVITPLPVECTARSFLQSPKSSPLCPHHKDYCLGTNQFVYLLQFARYYNNRMRQIKMGSLAPKHVSLVRWFAISFVLYLHKQNTFTNGQSLILAITHAIHLPTSRLPSLIETWVHWLWTKCGGTFICNSFCIV